MIFLYEQSDKKSREERLREAGEFYLNKLGRSMPQAEDCWRVERTKRGKPFFPDQPGLQFSISHSGSVWACVMAEHPVGLDIQEHTRLSHETEPVSYTHLIEILGGAGIAGNHVLGRNLQLCMLA